MASSTEPSADSNPDHEDHEHQHEAADFFLHHSDANGNGNGSSSLNGDNLGNHFWPPPQIIPYSYYSSAQPNPNSANHSAPSNNTASTSSSSHSFPHFGHHTSNTSNTSPSSTHSYPPPAPHWSPPTSSSNQQFQLPDVHPTPYQDHQAPFPLPLGMRIVGGKNIPEADENETEEQPWEAFAIGGAPSRRARRRRRIEPPSETGLGKTRCYWVLLSSSHSSSQYSPDLNFIYLDPVLQKHMGTEATAMLGTSFFDYVHPDERERTLADMSKIGEVKTLFGSVTRCRYSRVPHIRSLLGCAAPPQASDSYKYIFDEHYLAIDIVINWVGDGLALAFFHAVIDKSPEDNDEARKTEWTNWCGTPAGMFSDDEIEKIWTQVLNTKKNSLHGGGQAPEHVFQILEADALQISLGSAGQSYGDGSYFADDFARLAQGVSCSPSETSPGGANTSCTRRFRAKHTLTSEGLLRSIESVLIPYGSLVLACFKTTYQSVMSRSYYSGSRISPSDSPYESQTANLFPAAHPAGGQQYNSTHYHPLYNPQTQPDNSHPAPPSWIPLASGNSIGSTYDANGRPYAASSDLNQHQHQHHPHHQQRSSLGSLGELADATIAYADAPPGSGPAGLAPIGIGNSPGQASMRLAQNSHLMPPSHHHHPHPHPGMMQMNVGTAATATPLTNGFNVSDVGGSKQKRKRPSVGGDGEGKPKAKPTPTQKMPSDGTLDGAIQAASAHPPVNQNGDKCCTGCGTVNSPEWRKGPTGGKSLCNACGLRYSRAVSRAKKKEAALNGTPTEPTKKKKAKSEAKAEAQPEAKGEEQNQ